MNQNLKISDFSYTLNNEKIAKYPLSIRDSSKLLYYKNGNIKSFIFNQIADLLPQNSLLVFNNTKVIYARLIFQKKTGSKIEIFCLNPHQPNEYNLAFASKGKSQWLCIVGNLKKWKNETLELEFRISDKVYKISAKNLGKFEDNELIEFEWDNSLTFSEVLEIIGEIPIPPYLNRKSETKDKEQYQTIYSKIEGSVAAPTAGLHFTKNVFETLIQKKITTTEITLHDGAGTFKPVKTENVNDHTMHTEYFEITLSSLDKIIANIGNIAAVGTTSLRTIESLYWIGVKKLLNLENFNQILQWEVYDLQVFSVTESLLTIKNYLEKNKIDVLQAKTQIIIVPTYKFKIANQIITNFHQPNSTLLLLIAAFVGEDWKKIYNFALENEYRFLSYGDSSLLFRE